MGRWRGKARRVIAAVAVTDLAYRLFMREPFAPRARHRAEARVSYCQYFSTVSLSRA